MAKLEGNAAQDQPKQHDDNRQIEGRQQRGIDKWKCAPQNDAGNDKPGLIAIPDRRDSVEHRVTIRLAGSETKQHADPEIESIEQQIDQYADGQKSNPEQDHLYSPSLR